MEGIFAQDAIDRDLDNHLDSLFGDNDDLIDDSNFDYY